jgi:hypothetical protein
MHPSFARKIKKAAPDLKNRKRLYSSGCYELSFLSMYRLDPALYPHIIYPVVFVFPPALYPAL